MGLLDFFKNRRDRIIDGYLTDMVASGVSEKIITNLHFAAAVRYAQDRGSVLYDDMPDIITFDKIINKQNYSVCFQELNSNVYVLLTQGPSAEERVAAHMDQVVARVKAQSKEQSIEPDNAVVMAIRDRAIESLEAGKRLVLKSVDVDDVEEFYALFGTVIPVKKATFSTLGETRISVVNLPNTEPVVVYVVFTRNEVVIRAMPFIPKGVEANDELLIGAQVEINQMLDEIISQMKADL